MSYIVQSGVLIPKKWGSEFTLVNNTKYCGKIISCSPNEWSSDGRFHYHRDKQESFFVLTGTLLLELVTIRERGYIAQPLIIYPYGKIITILPGAPHRFKSYKGDNKNEFCSFLEISTPHEEEDSIRVDIPIYKTLDPIFVQAYP